MSLLILTTQQAPTICTIDTQKQILEMKYISPPQYKHEYSNRP